MPYQGRQPGVGVRSRYIYTASGGQTLFSGADDNGKTLAYQDGAYVDVYLNGVMLVPSTDFTATTKTSVTLTSGATASDIVEIVAYDISSIADTVSKSQGGTFDNSITINGDTTLQSGAPALTLIDTDGPYESIITQSGTHLYVSNASTGALRFRTSTNVERLRIGNSGDIRFFDPTGAVERILYDADSAFVVNEDSADFDFRVESDSETHMLFVDAGNNRVGIGENGPLSRFHLKMGGTTRSDGLFITRNDNDNHQLGLWTSGGVMYYDAFTDNAVSSGQLRIRHSRDTGSTTTESIYANDTTVVINDGSADMDFRVESDANANMFVIDAGKNVVSIGDSDGSSGGNWVFKVEGQTPQSGTNLYYTSKFVAANYSDTGGYTTALGFGVEPGAGWVKGAIGWKRTGSYDRGEFVFLLNGSSNGDTATLSDEKMRITSAGVTITGNLAKSSGSFKIDHPLPEKTDTNYLVHSFVEAPQADNIYRGKVALVAGQAVVNIDTVTGMTEGTFAALNREIQCFTSNETGWTAVRGSVSGNILTIEAQDNTCTDTVSWLVIGERQDQHMFDTDWTDDNGKVIVEPLKPEPQP